MQLNSCFQNFYLSENAVHRHLLPFTSPPCSTTPRLQSVQERWRVWRCQGPLSRASNMQQSNRVKKELFPGTKI